LEGGEKIVIFREFRKPFGENRGINLGKGILDADAPVISRISATSFPFVDEKYGRMKPV